MGHYRENLTFLKKRQSDKKNDRATNSAMKRFLKIIFVILPASSAEGLAKVDESLKSLNRVRMNKQRQSWSTRLHPYSMTV
jgi:hypothetical protein